jgi:hypothetical protein
MKLTTHLHLVQRSNNAWSYTSTPPVRLYLYFLLQIAQRCGVNVSTRRKSNRDPRTVLNLAAAGHNENNVGRPAESTDQPKEISGEGGAGHRAECFWLMVTNITRQMGATFRANVRCGLQKLHSEGSEMYSDTWG